MTLEPLAHLWLGQWPPIPPPSEVLAGPVALATLIRVMGRARSPDQKRRAAQRILELRGFGASTARDLATRMYS